MHDLKFIRLNNHWNAEPNAPYPSVETFAATLELKFLANPWLYTGFAEGDQILLTFTGCREYRLGSTNDEGWWRGQCRFSGIAPAWGEFYEIIGPTMDHRARGWLKVADWVTTPVRHFLFYFRDETFECKATDWAMQIIRREALEPE